MQTWFEYLSRTWFEWGQPQNFDPDAYKSYEHSMSDYPQHWGALWPVYYNEPSQEEIDNQCPMFADPNIFLLDQGNYKLDKDAKIFCWKKDVFQVSARIGVSNFDFLANKLFAQEYSAC